jgi:hypothetical protein
MAAYHWYFVGAAYGITAVLSLAVLVQSWWRMTKAERRVEPNDAGSSAKVAPTL